MCWSNGGVLDNVLAFLYWSCKAIWFKALSHSRFLPLGHSKTGYLEMPEILMFVEKFRPNLNEGMEKIYLYPTCN